MKVLLLTSLLGVAAGASSLTTYRLVHDVGSSQRYEMEVLPHEHAIVTLDRETGIVLTSTVRTRTCRRHNGLSSSDPRRARAAPASPGNLAVLLQAWV